MSAIAVTEEDLAEMITVNQAVAMLRISLKQGYRWITSGQLPAFRVGGKLRVRKSDVLGQVRPVEPARATATAGTTRDSKQTGDRTSGRRECREVEAWRAEVRRRSRI